MQTEKVIPMIQKLNHEHGTLCSANGILCMPFFGTHIIDYLHTHYTLDDLQSAATIPGHQYPLRRSTRRITLLTHHYLN